MESILRAFKVTFLWIVWASLVGTSVFYTTQGLMSNYPGEPLIFGISDIVWLGLTLCAGQYAILHVGFILVQSVRINIKALGYLSLFAGGILTVFNVMAAYTAMHKMTASIEVAVVVEDSKTELYQAQVADLREKRKSLFSIIENTPRNHSTNSRKLFESMKTDLKLYDKRIEDLNSKIEKSMETKADIQTKTPGTKAVNDLVGFDIGQYWTLFIAGILDPLSVALLLNLTAYGVDSKRTPQRHQVAVHKILSRPETEVPVKDKPVAEYTQLDENPVKQSTYKF